MKGVQIWPLVIFMDILKKSMTTNLKLMKKIRNVPERINNYQLVTTPDVSTKHCSIYRHCINADCTNIKTTPHPKIAPTYYSFNADRMCGH